MESEQVGSLGVVKHPLLKRESETSQQDSGPSSVSLLFGSIHRCWRWNLFMIKTKCCAHCLDLYSDSVVSCVSLEK